MDGGEIVKEIMRKQSWNEVGNMMDTKESEGRKITRKKKCEETPLSACVGRAGSEGGRKEKSKI